MNSAEAFVLFRSEVTQRFSPGASVSRRRRGSDAQPTERPGSSSPGQNRSFMGSPGRRGSWESREPADSPAAGRGRRRGGNGEVEQADELGRPGQEIGLILGLFGIALAKFDLGAVGIGPPSAYTRVGRARWAGFEPEGEPWGDASHVLRETGSIGSLAGRTCVWQRSHRRSECIDSNDNAGQSKRPQPGQLTRWLD